MKHVKVIDQFREELTKVSKEVEISVAMGHFDINKICEDVFCGIFKELYGLENLRNLNEDEKKNFPGIDLADDDARVAIQVTSDKTLEKIKDSIGKIIKHNLHEKYDRIIFYILTRKQGSYSKDSIEAACEGKIVFDVGEDILDFTDLATKAASATPMALKRAVDILGSYTRGCDVGLAEQDFDPPEEPPETLAANMLELYFPQTLYIAELLPEVFDGKKPRNQRKQVGTYVRSIEQSVPSDYEVSGGRLITFHNLEDQNNPFKLLIDEGTVEPFQPSDYYSIDEDHERVFKSLLRFCMQHKLHKHRVLWEYRERIFIFLPLEDSDNTRTETWIGQKRATRTVFERKFKRNEPEKVLSTRHFAFSLNFLTVEDEWYVAITPDWFFSYGDSYRQSAFGDKLLSGLKRMEKNRSVFDQFRFLCSWLRDLDSDDLFSENANTSPHITFGQILEFGGGRSLNEDLWEPLVVIDEDDSDQGRFGL
ncbi:MAG: SMEK domain-containing protein [Candidatus Thiodiazotropha sp. (ex Lucina aurantia)]|nr:SMEK domain-containing protein [Candidatus Thiodiazotropha taylori]MBV2097830.1 SMEK domain-containing protein [Candidatus Thiodiazotropha sp. (ex Codakia orbicularis)]MBV2103297.1 SMEK domain-containing protein [Candidatus Thiodiazotropha sp. (ex Lucina aurantia)]MBV2116340.1 SMEK domain-containing protein [Candidatus Thiodiazotropha sp. (ex Lucina aurantia)]